MTVLNVVLPSPTSATTCQSECVTNVTVNYMELRVHTTLMYVHDGVLPPSPSPSVIVLYSFALFRMALFWSVSLLNRHIIWQMVMYVVISMWKFTKLIFNDLWNRTLINIHITCIKILFPPVCIYTFHLMMPLKTFLSSSLVVTPPKINSSPDDIVVMVRPNRRSGRSPILTQEDVAGQYAWTAVLRLGTCLRSLTSSHPLHTPPSAKRHPPVAARRDP